MKKKLFFGAAISVAFCAVIVLLVVLNVSRAQALEVTIDTDYTIASDNLDITLEVVSNGIYIIDGSSILHNEVYINVVPKSTSVNNVEIILKDVRIQNSKDKPVIQFNSAESMTVCNYTLGIEGDCVLESTKENAKTALISAQSVNATVVALSEDEHTARSCKLSDLLSENVISYTTSLKVTNHNGNTGKLTLITGRNSYGAAIGSGESNLDVDVELSEGNTNIIFEPHYLLKEDGTMYSEVQSAFDYLNRKYGTNYDDSTQLPVGKEFLIATTINAADITIDGDLEVNIKGQGYGAGIGGGGSMSADYPSGRAGVVTINQGTVAINMTSVAPCIGSGRNSEGGQIGNGNDIIITGGSLYMNAVSKLYDGNMKDETGKKLYLFTVDLTKNGLQGFSNDAWNADIDISDSRYVNSYIATFDVASKYAQGVLNVGNYTYKGYGHCNISNIGISQSVTENKLYFYLPATPTAELSILNESYIVENQEIKIYQNDTEVVPEANGKYVLEAGKLVDVKVYDVPDSLEARSIVISDQTYPVSRGNDSNGDYYILSFKMPESGTTLKVNYSGEIEIVYHDGFLDTDLNISNHGYVSPSETVYSYGNDMALPNPTVNDLIFDGWYLTGTDTRVTTITSAEVLSGSIIQNGKIDLTAKWKSRISYVYSIDGGASQHIRTDEHVYGSSYTLDPASTLLPTPPAVEYYDFVGWNINSVTYSKENGKIYFENSVTSNITVNAEYKKNRFYVYVDKEFFDATDVDLLMGITSLDFETTDYEINGVTYRRALVTEAVSSVALTISAKQGYEISSLNWSVSVIDAASTTDNWNDNSITYQLGIGDKDIYVLNNNCSFIPKVYTITFFDGVDNTAPWKTYEYTVETMSFPSELSTVLGADAIDISTRNDRYHKFTGWKANTATAPDDPYVTSINNLGNYIFVAAWEEAEKHPINITVYDEETNEVSAYVAAIPYLYDTVYGSKAPIKVEEVYNSETDTYDKFIYVIPGDNIFIEFVAIDENGDFIIDDAGNYRIVEIGKGISFAEPGEVPEDYTIKYEYESKALEATTKKNHSGKQFITIPDDVTEGADISVSVRIKLTRFTIQYWDLRGYENSKNPITYTIFDEFDFEPIAENIPWRLVLADDDDTNYDDVTTKIITGVDRWSSGNLVLKADWPSGYTGLYNITIVLDENAKGKVEIVYPTVTDGYKETQSIFINVEPVEGYKLKANSLVYTRVDNSSRGILATTLNNSTTTQGLPMIITPINEEKGIYLFMMPGSDIEISAIFEAEVYDIVYNDMAADVINANPNKYTIEDEIVLTAPVREGYIFMGWKDEAGNTVTEIKGRTGDIELVPTWKLVQDDKETTNDFGTAGTTVATEQATSSEDSGEEETTTKRQYIGGNSNNNGNNIGGEIQTGDSTNVNKLILILVCAALLVLFVVVKRKDHNDDDVQQEE